MNFKKGSISVDNHLLNLLNSSSIIKKNTRLFLIWAVTRSDALFIARKGHTLLGVDTVQTVIKQMLKLAVLKNLIVNGIFAGNIDFDVDDVYDVVLITEYFIYCKKIK